VVGEQSGRLSAREVEILDLVAEGLTNREIARRFWVAENTVKFHLSRIYRKIGVANRTAAAMWWRDERAAPTRESRE
jgi:DNA-binding CsgD family transcriptional regulator